MTNTYRVSDSLPTISFQFGKSASLHACELFILKINRFFKIMPPTDNTKFVLYTQHSVKSVQIRKIRARKNSVFEHFSHSVGVSRALSNVVDVRQGLNYTFDGRQSGNIQKQSLEVFNKFSQNSQENTYSVISLIKLLAEACRISEDAWVKLSQQIFSVVVIASVSKI